MKQYLKIVKNILNEGSLEDNRTGIKAITIPGASFYHDMAEGFPLLTTKKMPFKPIKVELEGFINGITDKNWYKERGCNIWNEWCNPERAEYGHSEEKKQKMLEERDLGPIYGFQWRHFGAEYENYDSNYMGEGIDQLGGLIKKLKEEPRSRRLLVTAWNPKDIPKMALPPCHYAFQVTVTQNKINLIWDQRSVDTMLGLPFNIASYGLLLHLIAKETKMKEGKLEGFLGDVHIYENHVDNAKIQLEREPLKLPRIETNDFTSIFDWNHTQSKLIDYISQDKIEFPIAV